MQRLEVSGAVRPIYGSLGIKRLISCSAMKTVPPKCSLEPTNIHDVILLKTLILVLSAVTTSQIKCLLYCTVQRSGLAQGTCYTRTGATQKQIWIPYASADFK